MNNINTLTKRLGYLNFNADSRRKEWHNLKNSVLHKLAELGQLPRYKKVYSYLKSIAKEAGKTSGFHPIWRVINLVNDFITIHGDFIHNNDNNGYTIDTFLELAKQLYERSEMFEDPEGGCVGLYPEFAKDDIFDVPAKNILNKRFINSIQWVVYFEEMNKITSKKIHLIFAKKHKELKKNMAFPNYATAREYYLLAKKAIVKNDNKKEYKTKIMDLLEDIDDAVQLKNIYNYIYKNVGDII